MKKVKVIFALAGVALVGMLTCIVMFLVLPSANGDSETVLTEEELRAQQEAEEEAALEEEAKQEVERFQTEYGVEVSFEDMLEQVKIRKDYEKKYDKTYRLEEVFLADYPSDPDAGDEGEDAYFSILDQIQAYVDKYNIDESRYASMTAEEELEALEVEYGKLDVSTTEPENAEPEENVVPEESTEEVMEGESAAGQTGGDEAE